MLSLILGFVVTVAIWPGEVVSCRHFILSSVATFWAVSLVGIYPGRASIKLKDEEAEIEMTGSHIKEEAPGTNTSNMAEIKTDD